MLLRLPGFLFSTALLFACGHAAADTLHLASYGTNAAGVVVGPADASNTALQYQGGLLWGIVPVAGGTAYNLPYTATSPWLPAQGDSSWVAQDPGDYPGGDHVEMGGLYLFTTTFLDLNPADSEGTLTVLADDTAAVTLNGIQITAPAQFASNGTCDSGTPNCTTLATYVLPSADFVAGTNILAFAVMQEHGAAEGLDFVGQVQVTPEPASLCLLGSGFGSLGLFTRRRSRRSRISRPAAAGEVA